MRSAACVALAGVIVLSASPALSDPTPAPAPACVDNNDCLLAAYKKSIEAARQGRYVEASFGLLTAIGVDAPEHIRDEDVFDQWSQVWSAMTAAPANNASKQAYRQVGADELAALDAAQARPAIAEIVRRAAHTRIVILDEDHLVPRDRAFGLQVARALRPLGYTVLAAEALRTDGEIRRTTGYYLNDPVFADYLRQAVSSGYRLVAYESTGFTQEKDEEAAFARREQEQAENIFHRVLENHPNVKVLVYGGRHHAAKAPIANDRVQGRVYMAARLKTLSGIEPLAIDQAELGEQPTDRPNTDLYAVVAKKAKTESVVLFDGRQPLVVGLLAGAVDLQVVHPRVAPVAGRPGWLTSLGRTPSTIPAALVPKTGMRLVQAFLASEGDEAIPIDQVLVTAGPPVPKLMLPRAPKGRIRYGTQDVPAQNQN